MIYNSLLDIRVNNKMITPNEIDFMPQFEPMIGDLAVSISIDKSLLDYDFESCENGEDYLIKGDLHFLFRMLQNSISNQSKGPRAPKYLFNKVTKIDFSGGKVRLIGIGSTIQSPER
ncbi:MAG: hypothetical protein IPO40_23870 [Fibrobacteres bacterium]|nr:hypothetical protein [Fibrobacterota bacterium]